MPKIILDWVTVHNVLAAAITLEAAVRFWLDKHIDPGTAGFIVGFWGTAVANVKYNRNGNGDAHGPASTGA